MSFKQIIKGGTGWPTIVYHGGPSGVYTFQAREGIDTYQSYNPDPEAKGNRTPFSSGSIGTPPLALMSGGLIYPAGAANDGAGAGFDTPFKSNVDDIPDLSGIWKDTNVGREEDTVDAGDGDGDTGEDCSTKLIESLSIDMSTMLYTGEARTWQPPIGTRSLNPVADSVFINSEVYGGVMITGVVNVPDGMRGVGQAIHYPTLTIADTPGVTVHKQPEGNWEEGFHFVCSTGGTAGDQQYTIASFNIKYKDTCNPCYKENKDDNEALISCWPQVEERVLHSPLFGIMPHRMLFACEGYDTGSQGQGFGEYKLTRLSIETIPNAEEPFRHCFHTPRANWGDTLDFEVTGHRGGLTTMKAEVTKVGELVYDHDDEILKLSLVPSEWHRGEGVGNFAIKSREIGNNGEPFDPTEGELSQFGKDGLEDPIKYSLVHIPSSKNIGQLFSCNFTFDPDPVGKRWNKWHTNVYFEVIDSSNRGNS